MESLFTRNCLQISITKEANSFYKVFVSSDFSRSNHKGQLYIGNPKHYQDMVMDYWKKSKTTKLTNMSLSFGEIDYYDNITDIYTVPYFYISKGKRKVIVNEREHGCLPKDWSVDVSLYFKELQRPTPIIESVKSLLGYKLQTNEFKDFEKKFRKFIKSDEKYFNFEVGDGYE